MLTAKEIRQKFLEYFKNVEHEVVHSSPLIPRNDPTLLFANSGMVQFKSLFLGEEKRHYVRATTAQKCLRVSGKHNDLENVGRTARHHTFFEMLGNFSFGDYFKEKAIGYAWDFVTNELKLKKEQLYVTVFREDDEAFELWQKVTGIAAERIFRLDEKDNFWVMGDTGPCGPCSEIYIDQGADMACGENCGIGKCDCDRFLEIWNLVFMQYDQPGDGTKVPLSRPSIDTGMGLERVAAVCQGKRSNFDCDLFQDIIQYAASLAGVTYSFSAPDTNDVDTSLRVIADHSRAAAFLIADGTLPSNEGRGYVLRRLLRRALRFGTLMGLNEPFLYKTASKVATIMGEDYPELAESHDFIKRVVREEEERFSLTLEKGLHLLEDELKRMQGEQKQVISGEICFKLYDTFGFPIDIVNDIAEKRQFHVDADGFASCMQEQKDRARAAQKSSGLLGADGQEITALFAALHNEGIHSEFVGYTELIASSRIVALLDKSGLSTEELKDGQEGFVITGRTPFYGASGGQMGDLGHMNTPYGKALVLDTLKPFSDLTVHCVKISEGALLLDHEVELQVTTDDRKASARNHTCTHLLHASLRRILGSHVQQAGSLVDCHRLRFDFSHISGLSQDELLAIERDVNRAILANYPVTAESKSHEQAIKDGAIALFGEKYGETVRVLSIGDNDCKESVELCGGTHLERTGEAGCFCIISEAGVAAGTRRIEAVTGWQALAYMQNQRAELHEIAHHLKAKSGEVVTRLEALQAENKKLRKDLEKSAHMAATDQAKDIMSKCEEINNIKFLATSVGNMSIKTLRELMDDVRSKLASGIACLVAIEDEKVSMIIYVSKDLHPRTTAPTLIKEAATFIGGSGGGRPDMAQAGGTNAQGIEQALAKLKELIQNI